MLTKSVSLFTDIVLRRRARERVKRREKLIPGLKPDFKSDIRSETPVRSVVKSISWRIIGTMDTVLISWLVTGQIKTALSIGLVELFTKMLLYFLHERLWNAMSWGKNR